jgi:hypothetical protein
MSHSEDFERASRTSERGNRVKSRNREKEKKRVRLPHWNIEELFPVASRIVEATMERGTRTHAVDDWGVLSAGFHLDRARRHLDLLAAGNANEPHLAHAACRLLMALELARDV